MSPHPDESAQSAAPPTRPQPADTGPYVGLPSTGLEPGPGLDSGAEDRPDFAGHYRVVAEISRGGMGVVWRAFDAQFERPLAIKTLLTRYRGTPEAERRFLDEARVTGQLQHPGVPPVHEIGRLPDGRPFLAMKLIEGRTLAQMLEARADPADDLARFLGVFEQLCQAVAYAHARGVIHRDLKPGNVMVGAFGEVQVMDWGLAKHLGGRRPAEDSGARQARTDHPDPDEATTVNPSERTEAGRVLGTLGFMPPEQGRGEIDRLDERCDVFGLGAILCVILTGAPPFRGQDGKEVLRRVVSGDLDDAFARLDDCGADAELLRLARGCLAPDPRDRPAGAGAVAGAMSAYLASVQERLRSAERERAAAEVRAEEERKRRRLALGLVAAVVLLVSGAAAGGLWWQGEKARRTQEQALRLARNESDATHALDEAESLADRALTLTDNPSQWEATLAAARAAFDHAAALLRSEPNRPDAELAGRAGRVRDRLDADDRDRALAAAFEAVREGQGQVSVAESRFLVENAFATLQKAFGDYGLPVGMAPLSDAVGRIQSRPAPVRRRILTALDLCLYHAPGDARAQREWLTSLLDALDGDPWRRQARKALAARDVAALTKMAHDVDPARHPPAFLDLLSYGLFPEPVRERIDLLRRAQRQYPDDFWLNENLAHSLLMLANPEQDSGPVRPEQLPAVRDAVRFLTAALALRPRNAGVYLNLGTALIYAGDVEGALAALRQAIAVAPNYATAYNNLGTTLATNGRPDEAVVYFRKVIELSPRSPRGYHNLAYALHDTKRPEEMAAVCRQAIALDPNDAVAHNSLAAAWKDQEKWDEALRAVDRALELRPRYASAVINRAEILTRLDRLDEAERCCRDALAADARPGELYAALGDVLLERGRFAAARAEIARGLALLAANDPDRPPIEKQLAECDKLIALERKLPEVLKREVPDGTTSELLDLAELCARYQRQHATAVRLYTAAFAARSGRNEPISCGKYVEAARAAVRAAGGDPDSPRFGDAERTRLRRQALDWLRTDLAAWDSVIRRGATPKRAAARHALGRWQQDPAFAVVREPAALAKLPSEERAAWQQLWHDVDSVKRAANKELQQK